MNVKEARIRAEIAARGWRLEPHGKAWRVRGGGVIDLIVADLATLTLEDLIAPSPSRRDHDPRAGR